MQSSFKLACAVVATGLGLATNAHAAEITVTTTLDIVAPDGVCSLREALDVANANVATADCPAVGTLGDDLIVLPSGTIELAGQAGDDTNAGGDLDILPSTGSLTVRGRADGSSVVDGIDRDRVFDYRYGFGPQPIPRPVGPSCGSSG